MMTFLILLDKILLFQTIFFLSGDNLLLQFLVFALSVGIFRMSLVLRYSAALQKGPLSLSRMFLVPRPSSQAGRHFPLSVF